MADPTRIAFCITDLDPGGAERALVQIVRRLDRAEWTPEVYCLGKRGQLCDELERLEVRTVCLGASSPWDVGVLWRLRHELRRFRPRLLQTFLFHANMAGRVAALLAGIPVVVAGIRVAERERSSHLWAERLSRKLVSHYVCVSRSVAEFSQARCRLNPEQVSVIPNGVEFDRFAQASPADLKEFGISPADRTLLFVGRLHAQKGVFVLLEAIEPLRAHQDLHLLMVGSGPLEAEARVRVQQLQLERQVHWAGTREDVPQLMRAADALVLPSLWEGLPNVILEAMAAGLPVITSQADGAAELVTEGVTGWIAEPGNAESLRNAVVRWLGSTKEAVLRITEASQSIVEKQFTWDACAAAHVALYRQLLRIPGQN